MDGAGISVGCFFPLQDASRRRDRETRAILVVVFIFIIISFVDDLFIPALLDN